MQRIERLSASVLLLLAILCGQSGCSSKGDPNKGLHVKPTMRVAGKVTIDGAAPETPVQVKAYPASTAAADQAPSSGMTGDGGVFSLNTYNKGDGLPAGEYKLTFTWTELSLGGAALGGGPTDKLGGVYADPKKTPFSVTVKESKDVVDVGVFELKKSAKPTKLYDDRKR